MSTTGFDDFKTILFLSVDLVGSTEYKHRTSTTQGWVEIFTTFYEKFPKFLNESIEKNDNENTCVLELWKPVGDELIFETPVDTVTEILSTVKAFQDAVREYKEEKDYSPSKPKTAVSLKELGLKLKGSCFTAVIPFPDMHLKGENLHGCFKSEYIGPGIDTGFRILSKATPASFTISIEVAYAFAATLSNESAEKAKEKLFEKSGLVFVDYLSLKGVWRGAKYPLFALEEKRTTEIQDTLDSHFDKSAVVGVTHNLSFYDVKCLLEEVLLDKGLPAFLWLENRDNLKKPVRELYLEAKPVEENKKPRNP